MQLTMELFVQIAYATGIGVLIGLERSMGGRRSATGTTDDGERRDDPPAENGDVSDPLQPGEHLGIRTFTILSLTGLTAALVSDRFPIVAPLALGGVTLLVIAMYFRAAHLGVGITTELAAVATCGLGMLCHINLNAAGALALVITVLLTAKGFTSKLIGRLKRVELTDTLKFLMIILILLPLMPNRALDPYGAFNPYKVTLLVVLISGIGYVGYFLTKFLGVEKGLGLTGLLGGLTSSTAVTAAMAAQAKTQPAWRLQCAFATIVANATMFGRVLVVVALLDQALFLRLIWGIGTMAVVAAIATAVLWLLARRSSADSDTGEIELSNPFSLGPALKFAAFFVVILLVARLAKLYFGDRGLYLASVVSGLADVDAITLSIAEQTKAGTLLRKVGAIGISIAVVANSVVKSGIALYSGGLRFGAIVGLCLFVATGAGLAVVILV